MRDELEKAFLRLREVTDADEYAPMEQVIDAVLARLATARHVIDGFTLGAWARCIHCREMTRTRVRGTLNPEHMLCRREAFVFDAVGHPRPGPNRHDHKRAGAKPGAHRRCGGSHDDTGETMTTKHTPGPWLTVYEYEEQEADKVITSLRVAIPHKKGMNWTERFDTHAANEQLAAAAPDLLAALERLFRWGSWPSEEHKQDMELARTAIAKAKGVTP